MKKRFARSFARGKFLYKKWGKVRIIRELKFREISPYNIECAMQEIEDEYEEAFDMLDQKKLIPSLRRISKKLGASLLIIYSIKDGNLRRFIAKL